jgi:hypothetical protein
MPRTPSRSVPVAASNSRSGVNFSSSYRMSIRYSVPDDEGRSEKRPAP